MLKQMDGQQRGKSLDWGKAEEHKSEDIDLA